MIRKPKFKSHLRVEVVPPDLVFFLNESGYYALQGPLICLLAPLINGQNTVSSIVRQLKGRATAFDVQCGLLMLETEGLIIDARYSLAPGLEMFRDSLDVEPELFLRQLKKTQVSVVSFGAISTEPFISILLDLHIRVKADGDFTVVFVDDYLRPELGDFNREAIRHKRPWMLVKPVGNILWLGPVFCPPSGACWGCLARRLRENRQAQAFLEAHNSTREGFTPQSAAGLSSTVHAAFHLAATETLKWVIRGEDGFAETALITFDAKEAKSEKHVVIRRDNCAYCRRPAARAGKSPAPIILKSCRKLFTSDGGHRSVSSDATFQKYEHHISPITGIVDRVKSYHADAGGLLQAYQAGHIFVPASEKQELMRRGLRRQSAGKGMTPKQAQTSALCEALERYSGVFRGDEFRKKATYRTLGDRAIHPNACMNFSQRQYENREEWNRRHSEYDWVPQPFDERKEVEWTPAWSLTENVFRYVPTAYCYYGYALPPDHEFCHADSNGNAAGNTLEEAIVHAFLELVERDCAAIWWYNRVPRPGVDLDSFANPYFGAARDYYDKLGRDVWVLDITNDFGLPTFAAFSQARGAAVENFLLGTGTHFDPAVALSRALTEMNQFLPVLLSGRVGRILEPTGADLTFLKPDPRSAPKNAQDFPRRETDDLRDDVTACVELVRARGLQMLVLDQTRSDVGLPVVKVIVPGLRQFWTRFGRGRLYDVPVELGWLKGRMTEEELNPGRFFV